MSAIHNMFNIPDDAVLNPATIAEMLELSEETVRRWCRSGKLSCYNFSGKYVITGSDFKEFAKKSRVTSRWQQEMIQ